MKLEAIVSETYSGQLALVAGGTGGLGSAVSLAFLGKAPPSLLPIEIRTNLKLCAGKQPPMFHGWRVIVSMSPMTPLSSR